MYCVLFVLSSILFSKQVVCNNYEEIVDENQNIWFSRFSSKTIELNDVKNGSFKNEEQFIEFDTNSRVKRSFLKKPLRPTPDAAASSECQSCYRRRKGCLVVRTI